MRNGIISMMAAKQPALTPFVQKASYASSSDLVTHTVTFSAAPVTGHLLILIANAGRVLNIPAGWSRDVTRVNASETSIYSKISNGTETSISVTTTSGLSCTENLTAFEFATYTTFDQTAQGDVATGFTTGTEGPTGTTTAANEIAIAVVGLVEAPSGNTMGPFTSWNNSFIQYDYTHATTDLELGIALKVLSSTQTVTVTANWTASSTNLNNMLIATYK